MSSDLETLYAKAAWKRFDDEIPTELMRALTSAFALIAVADGDLAEAEDARFMRFLSEHPTIFTQISFDKIDARFRDICAALISDPQAGRQHALTEIAEVKGNELHCDLVFSAAQIAIAADDRELAAETALLQEICDTLDMPNELLS